MTRTPGTPRSDRTLALLALLAAIAPVTPAAAQHEGPAAHHSAYAEQESSGIAALSRQEHDDLLAGAGHGLARAAELHSYPGPRHVLDLAGELELTDEQREAVTAIHATMLATAQRLGAEIVEREQRLDMRFAHGHIGETDLRELTAEIAALYGRLRFAHLAAHLETRAVLSAAQGAAYDRLRGYGSAAAE